MPKPNCQHLLNRRYCAQDKLWGLTVPRRPAPCAIRPGTEGYCSEAECPWRDRKKMAVPHVEYGKAESYPSYLPQGELRVRGLHQRGILDMEESDGL